VTNRTRLGCLNLFDTNASKCCACLDSIRCLWDKPIKSMFNVLVVEMMTYACYSWLGLVVVPNLTEATLLVCCLAFYNHVIDRCILSPVGVIRIVEVAALINLDCPV